MALKERCAGSPPSFAYSYAHTRSPFWSAFRAFAYSLRALDTTALLSEHSLTLPSSRSDTMLSVRDTVQFPCLALQQPAGRVASPARLGRWLPSTPISGVLRADGCAPRSTPHASRFSAAARCLKRVLPQLSADAGGKTERMPASVPPAVSIRAEFSHGARNQAPHCIQRCCSQKDSSEKSVGEFRLGQFAK